MQGSKERRKKSSDTESYQIQIIRRPEASEVETRSRKSNSEQNSKVSEASEQEVRSRSSDSEQRYVKLQKFSALSEEIIRTQKRSTSEVR